jgi:hypothetical protein
MTDSNTAGRKINLLTATSICRIHEAALHIPEPVARLVNLACVAPWSVDVVAASSIDALDREEGLLTVPGVGGESVEIALGFESASTVIKAMDGRVAGPILVDHHGAPMRADEEARDFVAELMWHVDPSTADIPWTFRSLRESVFADMIDSGVEIHVAAAQAGLGWGGPPTDRFDRIYHQRACAEWWAWHIGVLPPPALARAFAHSTPAYGGRGTILGRRPTTML